MDIPELRQEIDAIDRNLLKLLARRLELALEINRAKQRRKLPLRDPVREQQVLQTARESTGGPVRATEAETFMRAVLDFSRAAVKRRLAAQDAKPLNIAILGLGLIGGSIARALKAATPAHKLTGVDLGERLGGPRESGLFEFLVEPAEGKQAVQSADVVFLCAPPSRNLELLAMVRADAPQSAIITDVGGIKREICEQAHALAEWPGALFVGGHPMAGKARAGFKSSSVELFEGKAWVLTPERSVPPAKLRVLQRLIESTGAAVQLLTPDEHDRIIPAVSHLPQLCSVALMLAIGGRDHGIAGPALRDMTRLAESDGELWHELLAACREQAVGDVQRLRAYLTELEMALGLKESVTELFARANELHREMLESSVASPDTGE